MNSEKPDPSSDCCCAVIWDFDGTLVDTRQKNLNVTRRIYEEFTGNHFSSVPDLQTLRAYGDAHRRVPNWRVFYAQSMGMSEADIDHVGAWWSGFQMDEDTITAAFEGISETLSVLAHLPHGIVSQNASTNITAILNDIGLAHHFDSVIGYEEVGMARQKPAPDGLLRCIEELTSSAPGVVFFVGDHITDALCAERAHTILAKNNTAIQVKSIRVGYGPDEIEREMIKAWDPPADHVAYSPKDIVRIVENYFP